MKLKHLVRKWVPRTVLNWLRAPALSGRTLVERVQYLAGAVEAVEFGSGWKVRCPPVAVRHFHQFTEDPEQAEELEVFLQSCTAGMRFLDVGAHYGLFALAVCARGGREARVACIEASPQAARVLKEVVRLNAAEDQVRIMNVAAGPASGTLKMLTTGPLGGDFFIVPAEEREDTVEVPVLTLEDIMKQNGWVPTHLKLDIEGFEHELVAASVEVFRACKPLLFLELHGNAIRQGGKDPGEVIRHLRLAGYTRFEMEQRAVTEADMAAKGWNCRLKCL